MDKSGHTGRDRPSDPLGDSETDALLITAFDHPLRRRILWSMIGESEISPADLSQRLSTPLSNVSYHVRVLAACRAIALVSTKPARGSMQHFYRLSIQADWARALLGLEETGDEEPEGSS
jgi:DNA-binding transcriptional ArsR family regulator